MKATFLKWTRGCPDILLLESCPAPSVAAYRFFASNKKNQPISISYVLITLLCISSNKPIASYFRGWWHNLRTTLLNWCMLGTQKSQFVPWSLRWTVWVWTPLTEWTRLHTRFTSFYIFFLCSHDESQHVSTGRQGTGHEDLQVENGCVPKKCKGGPWSTGCWGSEQDTEAQQWT